MPTSFVGGMNVPGALGRINATWPLTQLTVGFAGLTFAPRWFGRLVVRPYVIGISSIKAAFPVRGPLNSGVGLELVDGQLAYFWTRSQSGAVLTALRDHGVSVDPVPRKAAVWRTALRPTASGAALTRPLRRMMPWMLLPGIAVSLTFAATATPFGYFLAAFGLLNVAVAFVLWRRAKI